MQRVINWIRYLVTLVVFAVVLLAGLGVAVGFICLLFWLDHVRFIA